MNVHLNVPAKNSIPEPVKMKRIEYNPIFKRKEKKSSPTPNIIDQNEESFSINSKSSDTPIDPNPSDASNPYGPSVKLVDEIPLRFIRSKLKIDNSPIKLLDIEEFNDENPCDYRPKPKTIIKFHKSFQLENFQNPNYIEVSDPSFPIFTISFAICLSIVFISELFLGGFFINPNESKGPPLGPSKSSLFHIGACTTNALHNGQIWRLFSSIFVNKNIISFFLSLISQIFATPFEKNFGFLLIVIVFLISGPFGIIFPLIVDPILISSGPTGVICTVHTLIIIFSALFEKHGETKQERMKNLVTSSIILSTHIILSIFGFINIFASISGIVCAILLSIIIFPSSSSNISLKLIALIVFPICGSIVPICYIILKIYIHESTEVCKFCHVFNCLITCI